MKRFFERISQKSLDASQPPVLIVAFGDSVTQGVMELGRWNPEGVYHRLFQQQLEAIYPSTTFCTINAGVDGSTARRALERVPRDVVRHQPDLVLIAFGLNDCGGGLEALPDFEDAVMNIVRIIRDQTEADIVLITPPFMASERTNQIHPKHLPMAEGIIRLQTEGVLAQYAETIANIARKNQLILADVYEEWVRLQASGVDMNSWLCNGLNHPGPQGHQLAASVLFGTIFPLRNTR